jgi:two-component system, OmpR family, response regulator VanR
MMNEELLKELKNISILCVEDEDGIRQTIVSTLKYYFKEVYEASDGNEGFELYEYYKPKIVLTDIQMKNCNGLEFVKKIRKIDNETMVIMLTAYSNEEYLMELINLNINHFILKPLNSKKLNDALEKYLQKAIKPILLCEDLILDLQKRELIYQNEQIIHLRKREKDFLQLLYNKNGAILKYEEIEFELWNDKEMTSHALKSFIKELRHKIPVNVIKNIPQEGYTLQH